MWSQTLYIYPYKNSPLLWASLHWLSEAATPPPECLALLLLSCSQITSHKHKQMCHLFYFILQSEINKLCPTALVKINAYLSTFLNVSAKRYNSSHQLGHIQVLSCHSNKYAIFLFTKLRACEWDIFFCLFSFSWFLGFHRALYDNMEQWHNHITIGHVPTEKFRSVSSSFSFLSKSPLTLSTLFFLLSSSRSVFLGSYLRKKEKKLTF